MRQLAFGWPASSLRAWLTNSLGDLRPSFAALVSAATGSSGGTPVRLRVGVVHVAMQAGAAEDDHEAVLLHRLDEDLRRRESSPREA